MSIHTTLTTIFAAMRREALCRDATLALTAKLRQVVAA